MRFFTLSDDFEKSSDITVEIKVVDVALCINLIKSSVQLVFCIIIIVREVFSNTDKVLG